MTVAPNTALRVPDNRFRAYLQFVVAVFYYFLARALAHRGAQGISSDQWAPLVEHAMLVFLLLLGYAGVGFSLNGQAHPVSAQGLPRRPGWTWEAGLGLAIGWAAVVLCAAAVAVGGGIAVSFSLSTGSLGWFLVDAAFFALLALAEEIAFRGYPFQRFARTVGSAGALIAFAALYGFLQALEPGASKASTAVAVVFTILLSTAYLRTRALWVSWGINFGWKATRALLFGLAIRGVNSHSPVIQGDPMGPFWLTGGGFGLDGSWLAFFVLLAAIPVVYILTRDLDFKYNAPEIVGGGIPVDLDAAAHRQHEAAMGEPAPPPLVQIAPVAPAGTSASSQPSLFPAPEREPNVSARASQPISGNESD
jgi:membrane protease YdiL (CAAX protease family)